MVGNFIWKIPNKFRLLPVFLKLIEEFLHPCPCQKLPVLSSFGIATSLEILMFASI
jgi:hypothetical protein